MERALGDRGRWKRGFLWDQDASEACGHVASQQSADHGANTQSDQIGAAIWS